MGRRNDINVWMEFATEMGGKFVEGIAWRGDMAIVEYKNWKIEFDHYILQSSEYRVPMTRARAPIICLNDFQFEIYHATTMHRIEKFFGSMDVEAGYPEFDKRFIIKSNDTLKITSFLRNENIRELISSLKDVNFLITDRNGIWEEILPDGQRELAYYADGRIQKMETLKLLFQLFQITLDELRLKRYIK